MATIGGKRSTIIRELLENAVRLGYLDKIDNAPELTQREFEALCNIIEKAYIRISAKELDKYINVIRVEEEERDVLVKPMTEREGDRITYYQTDPLTLQLISNYLFREALRLIKKE